MNTPITQRNGVKTVAAFALMVGMSGYAAAAWEHRSSGDGTAFEERWVTADPTTSLSSDETLAAKMVMGAALSDHGGLYVWVTHPRPGLCEFSDWRLAVDKTVILVESELSDGEDATVLYPVDEDESAKLRRLFRDGNKTAIRVYANCDNMFFLKLKNTVTMTYSLAGSKGALEFLAATESQRQDAPERQKLENEHSRRQEIENQRADNERLRQEADDERHVEIDADAKTAYMFAIQQRISRNWVRPASAEVGLECTVNVRQLPGGEVVDVSVGSCNGDAAVRRSIESAVYKASPLPAPRDPSNFRRDITLLFKPEY